MLGWERKRIEWLEAWRLKTEERRMLLDSLTHRQCFIHISWTVTPIDEIQNVLKTRQNFGRLSCFAKMLIPKETRRVFSTNSTSWLECSRFEDALPYTLYTRIIEKTRRVFGENSSSWRCFQNLYIETLLIRTLTNVGGFGRFLEARRVLGVLDFENST